MSRFIRVNTTRIGEGELESDPRAGKHRLEGLLGSEDVGDERERDENGVVGRGGGDPDKAVGGQSQDARFVGGERRVGFDVGLDVDGGEKEAFHLAGAEDRPTAQS